MRPELSNLIAQMCSTDDAAGTADSVSWTAHRTAEALTDVSMLPELVAYLDQDPGRAQRQAAYFIIGMLGRNCRSSECASALIARVGVESDKYALASLLDRLADIPKPSGMDLNPIFSLLDDKRWLVRRAAITSLANSMSAASEDHLLRLLSATSDPIDMIYCHATLGKIGSERAVPLLERGLKSRKRDVRLSAQFALQAIAERRAAADAK